MPAMPHVAKLYKRDDTLGISLPREISDELGLAHGDTVSIELIGGRIEITRAEVDYNKAVDQGRKCATKYREVLAKIANC
jgi:antitoxin component of MazEF toxin-antitoxin module